MALLDDIIALLAGRLGPVSLDLQNYLGSVLDSIAAKSPELAAAVAAEKPAILAAFAVVAGPEALAAVLVNAVASLGDGTNKNQGGLAV